MPEEMPATPIEPDKDSMPEDVPEEKEK